jgi:hypothetical protein
LYGPGAFLRELQRILVAVRKIDSLPDDRARIAELRKHHEARLIELETAWLADIKQAKLRVAPSRDVLKSSGAVSPSAQNAAKAAVSKAVIVERPILRGMSGDPKLLDSIGSDGAWSAIASFHSSDSTIDPATRALMSFKDPSLSGARLEAAVVALERAVAEDTVRNEYIFHSWIHRGLADGSLSRDVGELNEVIYSELFLTPSWDSWLGLRPPGLYSGIDNDGIR